MRNWNRPTALLRGRMSASRLPMRNWNAVAGRESADASSLPDYLWGIETTVAATDPIWATELPDYLWGIETGYSRFSRVPFQASRLPMRNWNSPESCGRKFRNDCFQTTYEELKREYSSKLFNKPSSGFQTTYEELKLGGKSENVADGSASRLPMRNWNRYRSTDCLKTRSFQTTYEELKPGTGRGRVTRVGLPDYLWGIETGRNSMHGSVLPGFQTTYEELKHPYSEGDLVHDEWLPDYLWGIETPFNPFCPVCSTVAASRLPMRNWNMVKRLHSRKWGKLPDYLWGIETAGIVAGMKKDIKLPDYLWGIETWPYTYSSDHFRSASRLPMRNWNCEKW